MRIDEMILVSVDDHVCEPGDMWQQHLSAKWKERAPRLVHKPDGSDVWLFEGKQIPNVGLNAVAGRAPDEYGMEPTALSQLRPGCYDVNERVKDIANKTSPFVAPREAGVGAFSLTNIMLNLELSPFSITTNSKYAWTHPNARQATLDKANSAVIPHQIIACARLSTSVRLNPPSVI